MKFDGLAKLILSIQIFLTLISCIKAQWPFFKLFADKDKYTLVDITNLNQ